MRTFSSPAVGQFLHQDAVSPGGQGCPGHDPGRTPGGQGRRRRVTRIQLHHHGQGLRGLLPGPGRVRAVEGVAVQGACGRRAAGPSEPTGAQRQCGQRLRPARHSQPQALAAAPPRPAYGAAPRRAHKKAVSFEKISSICTQKQPSAMARTAAFLRIPSFFKRAGKKVRGRLDENQNAPSRKHDTISPRCCLQTTAPEGPALRGLLQQPYTKEAPWVGSMGGVLFFKLQRFFCGKAAGFPQPPLNAGSRAGP